MKKEPVSNLENLFFREKPARLLIHIKKEPRPYITILAKRIDATYAHTVKILAKMHSHGLVSFSKSGRIKYVTLTSSGLELAAHFEELIFEKMGLK